MALTKRNGNLVDTTTSIKINSVTPKRNLKGRKMTTATFLPPWSTLFMVCLTTGFVTSSIVLHSTGLLSDNHQIFRWITAPGLVWAFVLFFCIHDNEKIQKEMLSSLKIITNTGSINGRKMTNGAFLRAWLKYFLVCITAGFLMAFIVLYSMGYWSDTFYVVSMFIIMGIMAVVFFASINVVKQSHLINVSNEMLGIGNRGTIIYKGAFGKLEVAVKKIPHFQLHKEVENEIDFLIRCNGHPNIVQYHVSEKRADGYYLALELCERKTLKDWVKNNDVLSVKVDSLIILCQVTKGLKFLHTNNIIHRDLKPSNILFSVVGEDVLVKLSDFGISRLLAPGNNSKTVTSFGGTRGWTAAEMLVAEKLYGDLGTLNDPQIPKLTQKLDIFSIGCIFYFVLTNGHHPFGDDEDLYDYNIKNNLVQLKSEEHSLRLKCNLPLVQKMLSFDPMDRPDICYIQGHPILWSNQKTIDFLVALSNLIHDSPLTSQMSNCTLNLEANYFHKISYGQNDGWLYNFEGRIRIIFENRYKKHGTSVKKLIRLIRNLSNHYDEQRNQEIKQLIGDMPDGFINFWLEKFPLLINETWETFQDLQGVKNLKDYYI